MTARQRFIAMSASLLLLAALMLTTAPTPTTTPAALAQDDASCQAIVTDALRTIGSDCADLGRNEVCYGNASIRAELTDSTDSFEAAGDVLGIALVESLETLPADPDTGEWGVALLDLLVDLPESSDNNVRMVLFGGVSAIAEQLDTADPLNCGFRNNTDTNLTLRSGPSLTARAIDTLIPTDRLRIYAQSEDGEWYRSARGWVAADLGTLAQCSANDLPVVEAIADAYTAPFQAITLQPGDAATCNDAPRGMLVQAPFGESATVLVNGVELFIGSTALLTFADNNRTLNVANLDNRVSASFNNQTANIPVGGSVPITLDRLGQAVRGPGSLSGLNATERLVSTELLQAVLPTPIALPQTIDVTGNDLPLVFEDGTLLTDGTLQPVNAGTTTPPVGEWGTCGSCTDCGPYPSSECVRGPDNTCQWDPTVCRGLFDIRVDVLIPTVTCVAGTSFVGDVAQYINTFDPSATLDSTFFVNSSAPLIVNAPTIVFEPGNLIKLAFDCVSAGNAQVFFQIDDTALNVFDLQIDVLVVP